MTWMQTADGRAVDLLAPRPEDVDFAGHVAGALGRLARFAGHVPEGPYSVAEHCSVGALAILRDTGNRDLAAAFLLHDAHEAYIGDITRPAAESIFVMARRDAIAEGMASEGAYAERVARAGLRSIKHGLDRAIHLAAGMEYPRPWHDVTKDAIVEWDERMLETERRRFLRACARPWPWDCSPPRLVEWPAGRPRLLGWQAAAAEWLGLLNDLCPATRPAAAVTAEVP